MFYVGIRVVVFRVGVATVCGVGYVVVDVANVHIVVGIVIIDTFGILVVFVVVPMLPLLSTLVLLL